MRMLAFAFALPLLVIAALTPPAAARRPVITNSATDGQRRCDMTYPKVGEDIAPRNSFGEALKELAPDYPMLRVLDADVCTSTQTSKLRDAYPDKFYQMGIAEANMVCTAAGMATLGLMPLVSTFAVFLAKRALDQIRVSVAYPRLNVKINGSYGGLPTGKAGATHSSVEDIAIMRAMPHMKVVLPADLVYRKMATKLTLDTPGPVYLRTVRCPVPTIFGESHKLEWGKAEIPWRPMNSPGMGS